jgi:general secretion pathway protein D
VISSRSFPTDAARPQRRHLRTALAAISVALLLLAGCAAQMEHRRAEELMSKGNRNEAIEALKRVSTMEPENAAYRAEYLNQRNSAVLDLLAQAEREVADGSLDSALLHYRDVTRLEPGNQRATAGVRTLEAERRAGPQIDSAERLLQANQIDPALELVRRVIQELPQQSRALALQRRLEEKRDAQRQAREEELAARAAFKRPVTLQFRDTPLRMVFEAIARAGKINVIVDREVKNDARATIFVKDASIEDTLDVILIQNQLEKRVLNSNTLLIYPATAARQKELSELKVRSFQLSNIDASFMANIVKTMVKTKDIVTDPKSNVMVVRDTPEAVALVERLVAANDLPDPEVMLEVEVLEVSTTRMSEIGVKLPTSFTVSTPSGSASTGTGTGTTGGSLTYGQLRALARDDLLVSPLSATLNLMLQDGDTNVLASPRIRTRNKEKARILVGDKLPIITNLISPQQAGQNSVLTGSIQYVDVGIKLEVEPQVYTDGDVGIKLNLEVSNVNGTLQTQSGTAYQIGTRSASTSLRLRDGETQIMGGLISDDDRNSAQKVPGLGQLPVVGRLFSNHSGNLTKREIVLSITPRIIRPQAIADPRYSDAWSGTETSVRDRALRLEPTDVIKATSTLSVPAAPAALGTAPAARPLVPGQVPAPAPAPVPLPVPAPAAAAGKAPGTDVPATDGSDVPSPGDGAKPASGAAAVGTGAAAAGAGAAVPAAASAPVSSTMPGINQPTVRPQPGRVPMAPINNGPSLLDNSQSPGVKP